MDSVAFVNIDGATRLGVKAGVEETLWILERGAFEKVNLDMILERSHCDHISIARPEGCVPLPFSEKTGFAIADRPAQRRKRLPTPARRASDVAGNSLGCIHLAKNPLNVGGVSPVRLPRQRCALGEL